MGVLMSKLSVEDLSKVYGQKTVLDHISFEVQAGEFLSILWPSGCGKTTILRILMGLLEPDGGVVRKDGRDITACSPAERGMGIVFQNYALFENMTVQKNVEYALRFHKELRGKASEIAAGLHPKMTIHDLRMVPGNSHTNVVFDCVVPYDMTMDEGEIRRRISEAVAAQYPNYYCVITTERSFVGQKK